jgi:hypothetical protein
MIFFLLSFDFFPRVSVTIVQALRQSSSALLFPLFFGYYFPGLRLEALLGIQKKEIHPGLFFWWVWFMKQGISTMALEVHENGPMAADGKTWFFFKTSAFEVVRGVLGGEEYVEEDVF